MLRWFHLSLLLVACSCTGGTIDPGGLDSGRRKDTRIVWIEGGGQTIDRGKTKDIGAPGDYLRKVDLTTREEDPCTYGKCGKNLICMANVCKRMCTEPIPGCNAKTKQCKANQGCFSASSFSGACLETGAKYLQQCGAGKYCEQGTLCVKVGNAKAKCLRLCQYGCPGGVPCSKTNNGCSICVQ